MAIVNGEDAEFVIDLSGLPEDAQRAVRNALELNIPDELVEAAAKAAAEADGWYWGDGEPVTGRWMEYDFPHPRATATEYGAKTKPEYRRRTDAVLRAVAPLIVADELHRLAEAMAASDGCPPSRREGSLSACNRAWEPRP